MNYVRSVERFNGNCRKNEKTDCASAGRPINHEKDGEVSEGMRTYGLPGRVSFCYPVVYRWRARGAFDSIVIRGLTHHIAVQSKCTISHLLGLNAIESAYSIP